MDFPKFKIDEILKKIDNYYSFVKGVEKRMFKRSKSNRRVFETIKPSKNRNIKRFSNNN